MVRAGDSDLTTTDDDKGNVQVDISFEFNIVFDLGID
jgi:hypothetical protein